MNTKIQSTARRGSNGGRVQRAGKAPHTPPPHRGSRRNSLRYLRLLLFNSLPHTVLVLGLLLPAAARAQGAIEAWVQRYDGRESRIDSSAGYGSMAVDAGGNVYVTGTSTCNNPPGSGECATLKYSSAGVPLWTNYYGDPDEQAGWGGLFVAVDPRGDVVALTRNWYITPIKYSSAGIPLWTNRSYHMPAPYSYSAPTAMALDASGNVFVTGYADNYLSTTSTCLTLKYSSAGELLWTRTYTGPGDTYDSARAMAVDAQGNVVVTGRAGTTEPGSGDYLTLKYSSTGALLWTKRYNGPGGWNGPGKGYDDAWAVAVDSEDCIIVTGLSDGGTNVESVATIKYSSSGEPIWTNRHDEIWASMTGALAVDASGNVFVTGSVGNGRSQDYLTLKYSSAGVPLWTNRYHPPGNYALIAGCLTLDRSGNVFLTGSSLDLDTSPDARYADIVTIAYSSSGAQLWSMRYNGPASRRDWGYAVAVDANGSVYVAGSSEAIGSGDGLAQDYDYVTIKYVTPPFITGQPVSRTNLVGSTASFSVEVAGSAPFTYLWRRDGTNLADGGNISGVTTTNLLVANVQLADAGSYTVAVTNNYGSVTSRVAQLTVTIPPSPGRFTSFSYSPATGFSFIFRDATVGQPYRIQRSSSLAEGSWSDWQSFTYTEPTGFMDAGATGIERRFYRAVSP